MSRVVLIVALTVGLPAYGKLEIRTIQPCHGALGAERTSDDVFPHDEYVVRYQLAGVKTDKDGKTDLEVAVLLKNAEGKAVVDRKTPVQRVLSLGGDTMQTAGSITFPEKAPPGVYTLSVVVRDRISSETASFERKLTCKPTEFQVLSPRFFRDEEMKIPAGATMHVGEVLYYRLLVAGFDRSQKKIGLLMRSTFLDADGKDIGAKTVVMTGGESDPEKAAKSTLATFKGSGVLHRAGNYKLRIAIEDTVAKKTLTMEAVIKVVAP